MQDLALQNNIEKYCDLYPKTNHIRFDGNHLSTLNTLYKSLFFVHRYENLDSVDDISNKEEWIVSNLAEQQSQCESTGWCDVPTIFYLSDLNLVICSNHKAGSVSLSELVDRYREQTNKEVLNICFTATLLNLIESRDPEIWHIYRDPLMRFMSFFYYRGREDHLATGVQWSWKKTSMYEGTDTHRIPQFVYMPGYFKAKYPSPEVLYSPDEFNLTYNDWAYNNIEDFIPHKKIKFFWLHEQEVQNRKNLVLLLHEKLGIEPSEDPDVLVSNRNVNRPDIKKIDVRFIQKVWDSQIPERKFLSKLRWENGPIQFHGLP